MVIGGSSALGYPYSPTVSVGQIVAWQLEESLAGRPVRLDIRAQLGKNLEDMHKGLAGLDRRPDVLIIYSGHNEFLSRFDTSRDAGYAEAPAGAFLGRLYRISLHSPLCLLIYETVRKHRLGGPPPPVNHHRLIDPPMFTPSEYQEILADFGRRLDAITAYCEQIGTLPILVIPPANESGFEPNRSVLPESVTPAQRQAITLRYQEARDLEAEAPEQSIALYRSLLETCAGAGRGTLPPGPAPPALGRLAEARGHYIRARDLDGFPVRCPSEFAQAYRDVAARRHCILVDGPEVLRAMSREGILDDELFHDGHHPSLLSHIGLAQAIMDRLYRGQALGLGAGGSKAPIIDGAACAARFGVDAHTWSDVCVKSGTYYKHLADARFDPTERFAKHLRLIAGANDLKAGRRRPEELGIPGIGLARPATQRWDWWSTDPPDVPARGHDP